MSSFESPARPRFRAAVALVVLTALCLGIAPRPARADGAASTRNIILGAVAVAAAIIINNNIQHKRAQANTIVGYTRDGGTVYADGRIVYPDGTVLYAGNRYGQPCNWYAYGNQCGYGTTTAYYARNVAYRGYRHGYQDRDEYWAREDEHERRSSPPRRRYRDADDRYHRAYNPTHRWGYRDADDRSHRAYTPPAWHPRDRDDRPRYHPSYAAVYHRPAYAASHRPDRDVRPSQHAYNRPAAHRPQGERHEDGAHRGRGRGHHNDG